MNPGFSLEHQDLGDGKGETEEGDAKGRGIGGRGPAG